MDPLNPVEVRVLGSLVEKELTTPDYYPLTLNALTNACNQSSNRDPVVSLAEQAVARGLDSLRERKLAFVFQGADSRVSRFGHRVAESFGLGRPEKAVLCVLMLRGPQTVGEVRGRTERMHEFPNLADAEACLGALVARSPEPLVARLPRRPGMKEQRFAHLLSGEVAAEGPAAAPDPGAPAPPVPLENEQLKKLEDEVAALRAEIAELRRQMAGFGRQLE